MGEFAKPAKGKADFDDVYNRSDARAYYRVLGSYGYEIPQHGADVFGPLARERALLEGGDKTTILDVCCSYGVGGALLKSDLGLNDLYDHYRKAELDGVSGDELVKADASLLEDHRLEGAPRVIGLDVADQAITYAVRAGLLDDGRAENLEVADPSAELVDLLSDVDIVTTTGGIGYVTERTFERLLDHTEDGTWVAAFCLSIYDFAPIVEVMSDRGLVAEQASKVFPQRRFADDAEKDWALGELKARGGDVEKWESEGCYFADFYLARPAEQVAERPLASLLPDLV